MILYILLIISFSNCKERVSNNPFDLDCPKELFTPSDFTVTQEGTNVKLAWQQTNMTINGFFVNRSENEGAMAEVARVDKSVLSWTDTKVNGGTKYDYEVYAYAGANVSNAVTGSITTAVSGPVVTTVFAASNVTANSAVLGGNVTSEGGSAVTSRGVCYHTSQNPTTANSKVVMGSGTGEFSGTITGLAANTPYYAKAYAINSYATAYGAEISFSTGQTSLATVTTAEATDKSTTSATLGGNVTSDGSSAVTQRGVCYSTGTGPTTGNSKLAMGSGTGAFSNTVTGLTAGTTYYVRAYAINSQGTAYGNEVTFKTADANALATVTTDAASGQTYNSALLGGNVTNGGTSAVTERGICYNTSTNPSTSNNKAVMGSGTGAFSNVVTGLSANTTYYAKAYAINSSGTAYGNEVNFKTASQFTLASLTTNEPKLVTINSAELGGNISSDGNTPVTERGVCYSTSTYTPTTSHSKVVIGSGAGAFSQVVNELASNTTYYVRAYAINSVGTAYGTYVTLITLGDIPTVTTKVVTNVLETAAVAGGIVISDGGSAVTERGICLGTVQDPTIYDVAIKSGQGLGTFSAPLSTLVPNTTYFTRAYATNKNGTAYGENKSFITADAYYAGFENGMPTGWSGAWSVSSDTPYEGFFCLKSVNAGEEVVFSYTVVKPEGGQISFFRKAPGGIYDPLLEFYIDNVLKSTMGNEYWTIHTFPVTTGIHTFKWKNKGGGSSTSVNYIDYIICTK